MPFVAVPVWKATVPEVPELVVPVENLRAPLTPFVPAFTVFNITEPLDVSRPAPVDKEIDPPVAAVEDPALPDMSPPTPVFPDPTAREISPPLPLVAAPDVNEICPDEPELVVPDWKLKLPLTPAVPALTD